MLDIVKLKLHARLCKRERRHEMYRQYVLLDCISCSVLVTKLFHDYIRIYSVVQSQTDELSLIKGMEVKE